MANKGIVYGLEQKIDEKDKKILKALVENGRATIAELEKKTRIRRDSIARRLTRLEKEKVITGFTVVVNTPAIGLPNVAIILIRTKTSLSEKKELFQKKLVENKFLVHIVKLIGKFDFSCSIVYKDSNHLNEIIESVKNYVPNFIEDFELFQVVEEPKYDDTSGLL